MNGIDHADFVPCDFTARRMRAARDCARGLRPLLLDNSSVLSDCDGKLPYPKTIHVVYDPVNFHHVSLIARLFSRTFVNHSDDDDISDLATVIKALPQITFALPELQVSLQFTSVADEKGSHDRTTEADLRPFLDAAPGSVKITWLETLMWRRDSEGKISERWQAPAQVQEYTVAC
jgi:hypothetical protein